MDPRLHHAVDLWLVSLDSADAPSASDLDDAQDRARCEQLLLAPKRRQFAFRRRALRYVLARYLPAYSLEVEPSGKPFIRTRGGRSGLRFSTSSSRDVCAVCVCTTAESGVDIEAQPTAVDLAGVLARFAPGRTGPWPAAAAHDALQPMSFRQHLAVMSWCQLEAHTKLHGRTLHETLFEQPEARLPEAFDRGCTHLAVVANLDVVCVVAQRQPFHVAQLHQLDYARIAREQA